MPKDQWKREKDRVARHKAQRRHTSLKRPKILKTPNPRKIPAGSDVMIRKVGEEGEFRWHKTKVEIIFKTYLAATEKSILIEHDGWSLWVPKRCYEIMR